VKILLTNDDGIHARGLLALEKRLGRRHEVTVVAPDRERTAVGHGITLSRPLRAVEMAVNGGLSGYAVNGTPADCVILGVKEILCANPDLVISGINPGANLGNNVNYSGTVAAAREATLRGIPALSVSVKGLMVHHYEDAADFVCRLVEDIRVKGLPSGTFLNVNLPDIPLAEVQGVRICRLGIMPPREGIEKRIDPRQRIYYWHGPSAEEFDAEPDFDGTAVNGCLISITPIKCDATDYDAIDFIRSWGLGRGMDPAA
jgi:5'-nucleotidase